ncbi:UNVERIFIED_CONTAM: hypothetical protein FKN15_024178 [Acipenser sinensis]
MRTARWWKFYLKSFLSYICHENRASAPPGSVSAKTWPTRFSLDLDAVEGALREIEDISTSGINADYSSPAVTLGSTAPQSQTPEPNTYNTGSSTSTMKVYTSVQSTGLDISTSGINADYSSPAVTLGSTAPQSQTPEPNTYNTGSSTSTMKVYTSVQSTGLDISTSGINADYSSPAITLDISTSGINADYSSPAITLGSTAPQSQTPEPNTYNTVPVEDVTVESDPPSAKVWEGERLTLTCNAAKGNRLRYEWHFKTKTATMKSVTSGRSMTIHRVLENQAGNYSCVANNNLTAGHSQDIEVEVKARVRGVSLESRPHPLEVSVNEEMVFTCSVEEGTFPVYKWMFNGHHLQANPDSYSLNQQGNILTIPSATLVHNGTYVCSVCDAFDKTHCIKSAALQAEVKARVRGVSLESRPHPLEVSVNEEMVFTCSVEEGTFPVYKWMFNGHHLQANPDSYSLNQQGNILTIPSATLVHNGTYVCSVCDAFDKTHCIKSAALQAEVKARVRGVSLESRPHPLEVSVNEEMVFTCSVEEGTFPVYKWMFNGHHLQANPDSYSLNQQGNILTIPSATLVHNGTYVCSVCDAFDKTHCIKSAALQAEVKEAVPVSIEDIAVAFGCFLLLVIVLSVCCVVAFKYKAVPVSIEDIAVAFGCFLLLVIVLSVCCVVAFKYRTGEYNPNSGVGMEKSAIWDKDMDEQVFAIIVFACITAEGYINPPGTSAQECVFGGSLDACHYGVGVGFLAFLAATAFFILDIYFPQISNANERKYIVIADLVFSGVWSFLWFVGFCFLTNKWVTMAKITVIGSDSARAVITFSFFSIFTWGLLACFALRRYRQGMGEFPQSYTDPAPDTTASYAGYPPVDVESYQQPPFDANPDPSGEGGYQPPVY